MDAQGRARGGDVSAGDLSSVKPSPRRPHAQSAGTTAPSPSEGRRYSGPPPKASAPASAPARPYPALKLLPEARPLPMPRQDLAHAPARAPPGGGRHGAAPADSDRRRAGHRRRRRGGPVPGARPRRLTVMEWVTLVLSTVLSAWVGFGFMSATAGFFAALGGRLAPGPPTAGGPPRRAHRDPAADLQRGPRPDPGGRAGDRRGPAPAGPAPRYDFFILSDTRDEAVARAEAAGLLRLRLRAGRRAAGLLSSPRRSTPTARPATSPTGSELRRRLRLHGGARRRQPDVGRDHGRGWPAAMDARPGRRPDPDRADDHQRRDPVRPRCSSSPAGSTARCSPGARPGGRARRATTGATTPSSGSPPSPSSAGLPQLTRPRAVRRPHPEPRLRRGGAAAPRAAGRCARRPTSAAATRRGRRP